MMKVRFEENEYLVMAMFNTGTRSATIEKIEEVLPHVEDDAEIYGLTVSTIEKMKRISNAEYHKIDLTPYLQEPEDEE